MSLGRTTVVLISILLISKTISYSWSNKQTTQHFVKRDEPSLNECDSVYLHQDQCAHVLEYCMDATPGLINYIQLYFCSPIKPFIFLIMCCWLLFLFGFVGIAASDFFCPNLQTIASALHLSESLTGVTFLALGNGSPDLFSTFSAMHSNLGSLALGELIGAASFIVSVVAGSMCAIKPFRAKKFSFIRDVTFFTLAIILVMVFVSDGLIYLYEAIILILFYVTYVMVVVGGNYYMKKRSNYRNLVERARLEYEENSTDVDDLLSGNLFNGNEDEMELYDEGFETEGYQDFARQRNGTHPKLRIRASLFSAIEFQDVVQSLRRTSTRFNHIQRRPSAQNSNIPFVGRPQSPQSYRDDLSLHTAESRAQHDIPTLDSISSPVARIKYVISDFIKQHKEIQLNLFPTLVDFKKKSFFSKISSLLSAPVVFLLAATLPVVKESSLNNTGVHLSDDTADLLQDYNDEDDINANTDIHNLSGWNQWLTAVQLVCSPMLISFVMVTQDVGPWYIIFPVCFGIGIITAAAFWFTTSPYKQPPLHWMMCFVGFGVAVVWIFLIANEVVSVLQAIGMALGVSEAILGLTVFALGNSLGDFVANITMAKMGYPLMAMSACFGGPMLNIMLGVGIGATYVTSQRNEPYAIELSKSIVVSAIGLLIVLVSSLILVPLNGYKMSRVFGYSWITVYLICTTVNLYLEIRS
ncbi:hypothetical protein K501DRAFT_166327 [Backusella circina FSU 941]|nr:hypothetical protein K501DRAFT_166327 [Backusella circina FSU 941]